MSSFLSFIILYLFLSFFQTQILILVSISTFKFKVSQGKASVFVAGLEGKWAHSVSARGGALISKQESVITACYQGLHLICSIPIMPPGRILQHLKHSCLQQELSTWYRYSSINGTFPIIQDNLLLPTGHNPGKAGRSAQLRGTNIDQSHQIGSPIFAWSIIHCPGCISKSTA